MTIHVNIGAAKTRLSELVAAAMRGEEVVLDRAGSPQVRLVRVAQDEALSPEERAARRRSAFGMFRDKLAGVDLNIASLKREDRDYQDALDRKYGVPD